MAVGKNNDSTYRISLEEFNVLVMLLNPPITKYFVFLYIVYIYFCSDVITLSVLKSLSHSDLSSK